MVDKTDANAKVSCLILEVDWFTMDSCLCWIQFMDGRDNINML